MYDSLAGRTLEEAFEQLSYENARTVLKRAGDMARTLVAVGAGRPGRPEVETAGQAES